MTPESPGLGTDRELDPGEKLVGGDRRGIVEVEKKQAHSAFISAGTTGRSGLLNWVHQRSDTMAAPETSTWDTTSFWSVPAEEAFDAARRRARREDAHDRNSTLRPGLIPFDEVAGAVGLLQESSETVQTVLLEDIVGSVGKDHLFTSSFHPRSDSLRSRWKRAFAVAHGSRGYEPVELYEVDGRYFVVDGHFRISVGRALGYDTIQAIVHRWA
jgi:hypothetical protein